MTILISITLTRKELTDAEACQESMKFFDTLCEMCGTLCEMCGTEDYVSVQWTPLHAVWLAVARPSDTQWLQQKGLIPIANLSGVNLSGADLSGANLSRADLSRADLSRADLFGANLSGANLSGAYLSRANLSRADLYGANLSEADLSRANYPTGEIPKGWTRDNNRCLQKS